MKYLVNVHYEGGWQFEIEAENREQAEELAEERFGELSSEELVNNLADIFVDECYAKN